MQIEIFVLMALAATINSVVIDPDILQATNQGHFQTLFVSFEDNEMDSLLDTLSDTGSFVKASEKRMALTMAQKAFTFESQKMLRNTLSATQVEFQSFWINNKMAVYNANYSVIQAIAGVPGVSKIEKEPVAELIRYEVEPYGFNASDMKNQKQIAPFASSPPPIGWHLSEMRVEDVWDQSYTGKGVVIASVDSGARHTHESLFEGWRKDYGWFDPIFETKTPNDDSSGTHILGTASGRNGIGVAPESSWIACKGCAKDRCKATHLFACAEWIQCPTKPDGSVEDCAYAPDVVVNGWGSSDGGEWFDKVLRSWNRAQIIPVFASGNTGPECGQHWYPGDRKEVISVGGINYKRELLSVSGMGPSKDERVIVKPDLVVPAQWIHSAWHTQDYHYATYTGTDIGVGQLGGVIALMKSKQPELTFRQVYKILTKTAEKGRGIDTSSAKTCGKTEPDEFPNNAFGYGRVDALRAVNAVPDYII